MFTLQLEYTLNANDYVNSSNLHSPNVTVRVFYWLFIIQMVPTLIFIILRLTPLNTLLSFIPQGLIWLGVLEIQKAFYRRRLTKVWEDDSGLSQAVRTSISEDGIIVQEPKSTANHPWDDFRKVKESKESFLLFISKRRFYIIPKRALSNLDELNSFQELMKQKIASYRSQ